LHYKLILEIKKQSKILQMRAFISRPVISLFIDYLSLRQTH
jgi:hypothetical protein